MTNEYNEGREAWREFILYCPYPEDSDEWMEWTDGWLYESFYGSEE